jgi:exo-poly-alpha-galacturonosidase
MKNNKLKFAVSLFILLIMSSYCDAIDPPSDLKSPPGTETHSSVVLLWDKPLNHSGISGYDIYMNGKPAGHSGITNFTVRNLKPGREYSFFIRSVNSAGELSPPCYEIKVATRTKGRTFDITSYGAIGDSTTLNTAAIQRAIDACTPGGTVLIPAGIFLSGALFLKSDMTLYIAKGGVLRGSADINDYYPIIQSRFEGWKVESFSSLLTAGKYDTSGMVHVRNLAIRGEGKISGGDAKLGKAMTSAKGIRSRGRLICLMNCENLDIQGLTVERTPCWTIHYTFCKNVSIHDLKISSTAPNGDGIDPDSSVDSYIFNCSFSTGDDCIAIKSGKNPEGNIVGKPTKNVWITDCNFINGHSLAIGSEMSGGVENVIIRDCKLGNLYYGLQIKGSRERGGYVKDVVVKECDLQQIKIVTSFNYNRDGAPAPEMPLFHNIEFTDLNMTKASTKTPVIYIEGFDNPEHYTRDVMLKNILLPQNSVVYLNNCNRITFENVLEVPDNKKPAFNIVSSTNIRY